jgi:hypothetical protein
MRFGCDGFLFCCVETFRGRQMNKEQVNITAFEVCNFLHGDFKILDKPELKTFADIAKYRMHAMDNLFDWLFYDVSNEYFDSELSYQLASSLSIFLNTPELREPIIKLFRLRQQVLVAEHSNFKAEYEYNETTFLAARADIEEIMLTHYLAAIGELSEN